MKTPTPLSAVARRAVAFCLAAGLALLLAACGSKFNAENFDRVKSGMKPDEVRAILGPPSSQKSAEILGIKTMTWTYAKGKKSAELQFVGESLVEKSGSF